MCHQFVTDTQKLIRHTHTRRNICWMMFCRWILISFFCAGREKLYHRRRRKLAVQAAETMGAAPAWGFLFMQCREHREEWNLSINMGETNHLQEILGEKVSELLLDVRGSNVRMWTLSSRCPNYTSVKTDSCPEHKYIMWKEPWWSRNWTPCHSASDSHRFE